MWYFPIEANLLGAIFGNMYLGFEGTPTFLWVWSSLVSTVLIGVIIAAFFSKKDKRQLQLLLLWLTVPLICVISISLIKPVFTSRYLLYTVIPLIFFIVYAFSGIPNAIVRNAAFTVIIVLTLWFNSLYAPYHKKVNFRDTLATIQYNYSDTNLIVSRSALSYFEVLYYAKNPSLVYLLRSDPSPLPSYVGSILIPKSRWISKIPEGQKAYIVNDDGSYEEIQQ